MVVVQKTLRELRDESKKADDGDAIEAFLASHESSLVTLAFRDPGTVVFVFSKK